MAVTLSGLREMVNRKLGNHLQWASATDTGDGSTTLFRLPHQNVVESSLVVSEDGVEADYGTLDEDSGWYQFSTAPGDAVALVFTYSYRHWSDTQVNEALNSAIYELFGRFYVENTSEFETDGSQEYAAVDVSAAALAYEDRIKRVELWSDPHWVKVEGWRVMHKADVKYLHFETAPVSGYTVRVTYITHAGELSGDSTLLTSTGLPERAKEPVYLYACAELLTSRIAPDLRDDRAHNTQNENRIKTYEIVNNAQFFRAQAELKASKIRMPAWGARVTF